MRRFCIRGRRIHLEGLQFTRNLHCHVSTNRWSKSLFWSSFPPGFFAEDLFDLSYEGIIDLTKPCWIWTCKTLKFWLCYFFSRLGLILGPSKKNHFRLRSCSWWMIDSRSLGDGYLAGSVPGRIFGRWGVGRNSECLDLAFDVGFWAFKTTLQSLKLAVRPWK